MWRDILLVLGFVFTVVGLTVALLAWLQITPQHLRDLTRARLIRDWLIWPMLATGVGSTLIVFNLISHTAHWWSYTELVWTCVYFWLLWIVVRRRDTPSSLGDYLVSFAPVMYLVTGLARIDNAFNTSVFDNTSPALQKWLTLSSFFSYILLVGVNLGFSFRHARFSRLLKEFKKNCVECESIQNKAKEAIKTAEEVISKYETGKNNVTK